ncbi:MAG: DEAD/DEAH box helicase [Bacteroidetes bacterium]|nr:DEAD/DEAH box helicase [Bacteroidota bacterium]
MKTFADLGVSESLIKGLTELKILSPTEIQEKALPFLMENGTDFIGQAQTGTGKTAAFGLPLLMKVNPKSDKVQALILSPTRELGQQIAKQLFRFTKYSDKIFVEAVYGGEKIDIQIARLNRPTHIVVATPGRLIDLLERKAIELSEVKTIVLDEADEMLSMGFKKELDMILTHTKGKRHTWLFSATMPKEIKDIIGKYMAPDAFKVEVDKDNVVNRHIDHQFVTCDMSDKFNVLLRFIKSQGENRGVIFCKTKSNAQTLAKQLMAKNIPADAIEGDMQQRDREKVMRAFKSEKLQILVATDLAARGIDVEGLSYVVHYQLPDQIEYYTHRSGRTARAGKHGLSLSLVTKDEMKNLRFIEKNLGISILEAK